MALSDMVVFNTQVQKVATEVIAQAIMKFNEASNNTLIMGGSDVIGDYLEEASYKLIAGLAQRRNAYGSGAVAPTPIGQIQKNSVKVDGRIGPVSWDSTQFRRLGKSEEEAGLVIGEQAAAGMLQDQLNTILMCLKAAISGNAGLVHDGTASTLNLSSLNSGKAKFGDRSQAISAWVMHSKSSHDLVGDAISNANRLFTVGDLNVYDTGLGRPIIVTDAPALITSGTPDNYHTLGLVQSAGVVEVTNGLSSIAVPKAGDENISVVWQGEYDFTVGMLGYGWDKANGGASPNNAALGTSTNWDKTATSDKDTAGVIITSL